MWIAIVVATILVIAVNLALFYALRRYRAARDEQPAQETGGRRTQLRAAGGLTGLAIALLVIGIVFTDKAQEAPATGGEGLQDAADEPLRIKATGQQWLWRYDYPNGTFSFYKLVVPVDTAIRLDLTSTDVVHTWDVPALAPKRAAVPGKRSKIEFSADETGTFQGYSAALSGQAYAAMRTAVEVVSASEYEHYTEQLETDILTAQEEVVAELEEREPK